MLSYTYMVQLFWERINMDAINHMERKPLLLRGSEVADQLGISRALAYRWMASGILPTVRVSRSIRVPREELMRWITARTNNPVRTNCGGIG